MKKAPIALAFLCLACGAFALDFRGTTWLVSKAQVIDSENTRVLSELNFSGQQRVIFQSLVAGFTATITYQLENDKLLSASYAFRRDTNRLAFNAVLKELIATHGAASFQVADLVGWRLEHTEIALTHLPDGSTRVDYWEKSYFARINSLNPARN